MREEGAADGALLVANIVAFGRRLRDAGVLVDAEQVRQFGGAIALVGAGRRSDVKAAGRVVFVRRAEDRAIYDALFDTFWRRSTVVGGASAALPRLRQTEAQPAYDVNFGPEAPPAVSVSDVERTVRPVSASAKEQLRTADFADLTPAETRDALAMIATLSSQLPRRSSRRRALARSGYRLAARAMTRRSLGTGGEPLWWRWLRRRTRPRSLVLVCDISGSMQRYTRFLLRFAHAFARSGVPVEAFVFGTSLTRITRDLRTRDADVALGRVAERVTDWSGGTRIGASLHTLNRRWVRRTVRSSAVVLLVSDGWERDDPQRLGREVAALRRSCHRLFWLDPLASQPGFSPETAGLKAALPFVDEYVPCGNLASLEALAERLAGLTSRTRSLAP